VGVIRKQALILNLPGQPKSIKETLEGVKAEDGSVVVHGIFRKCTVLYTAAGWPLCGNGCQSGSSISP
jgi:molybdopterin biosynthesis enzyme MoaB